MQKGVGWRGELKESKGDRQARICLVPWDWEQRVRRSHSRSVTELGMRLGIGTRGMENNVKVGNFSYLLPWPEKPVHNQRTPARVGAQIKQGVEGGKFGGDGGAGWEAPAGGLLQSLMRLGDWIWRKGGRGDDLRLAYLFSWLE